MSAQVSRDDDERNECFYSLEGGARYIASHYSLALLSPTVFPPPTTHFCHSFIQSPPTLPPARRAKQLLPPLLLPLE